MRSGSRPSSSVIRFAEHLTLQCSIFGMGIIYHCTICSLISKNAETFSVFKENLHMYIYCIPISVSRDASAILELLLLWHSDLHRLLPRMLRRMKGLPRPYMQLLYPCYYLAKDEPVSCTLLAPLCHPIRSTEARTACPQTTIHHILLHDDFATFLREGNADFLIVTQAVGHSQ